MIDLLFGAQPLSMYQQLMTFSDAGDFVEVLCSAKRHAVDPIFGAQDMGRMVASYKAHGLGTWMRFDFNGVEFRRSNETVQGSYMWIGHDVTEDQLHRARLAALVPGPIFAASRVRMGDEITEAHLASVKPGNIRHRPCPMPPIPKDQPMSPSDHKTPMIDHQIATRKIEQVVENLERLRASSPEAYARVAGLVDVLSLMSREKTAPSAPEPLKFYHDDVTLRTAENMIEHRGQRIDELRKQLDDSAAYLRKSIEQGAEKDALLEAQRETIAIQTSKLRALDEARSQRTYLQGALAQMTEMRDRLSEEVVDLRNRPTDRDPAGDLVRDIVRDCLNLISGKLNWTSDGSAKTLRTWVRNIVDTMLQRTADLCQAQRTIDDQQAQITARETIIGKQKEISDRVRDGLLAIMRAPPIARDIGKMDRPVGTPVHLKTEQDPEKLVFQLRAVLIEDHARMESARKSAEEVGQ